MDAFPAYFALAGQTVVIAGSGDGASAKARLFEGSPARLLRIDGDEAFEPKTYAGARLAFIDGEDMVFATRAAQAARSAGALVNVVDRPALSDFSTPALIDRGSLVAAVGTAGASPMLAAVLRGEIESRIPEGAGRVAALLHKMKDEVREAFPDMADRRAFLREAAMGPAAQAAMDGDGAKATTILRAAMAAPDKRQGRVFLLDGSGPADLLSLRALRALSEADAIMADPLCDPLVLARARRDATRLPVDEATLKGHAASGLKVVRITAGPPPMIDGAVVLPVARP
jgi:precorrin-2 dehydrogenase/sirohydrochlorin ferrochelatase